MVPLFGAAHYLKHSRTPFGFDRHNGRHWRVSGAGVGVATESMRSVAETVSHKHVYREAASDGR
jgi:hypothetical protein